MNEERLDRVIDTAAGQMVAHEPPRTFADGVMARVGAPSGLPRSRSFAWVPVGAAAAATVAVLTVIVMLNRAPELPPTVVKTAPSPPAEPAIQPDMTRALQPRVGMPISAERKAADERPRNFARPVRRSAPAAPIAVASFDTDRPITFESIVPAAIEVPRLEVNAASIEAIEIEPIVVEPLTASND